jgi:hypothetical protein
MLPKLLNPRPKIAKTTDFFFKKILQPMRWDSIHLGDSGFFLLRVGGVLDLCCSHEVPTLFPSNSQWVLNMFPNFSMSPPTSQCVCHHVLNSSSLYPISFALSFTLLT